MEIRIKSGVIHTEKNHLVFPLESEGRYRKAGKDVAAYLNCDDLEGNVRFSTLEERLTVCYVDLALRCPLSDLPT